MGLFSGSTKTTQTPNAPAWLTGGMQDVWSGAQGIDPSSLFPNSNMAQDEAVNRVGALTGSPGSYDAAKSSVMSLLGAGAPSMSAASAAPGISTYMNPYQQDVINTSLQGFDENAGMQRSQQSLDQARSGNFDSGGAIGSSLLERGIGRDRSALQSGLLSQGWNTAADFADRDANRTQAASQANLQAALSARSQQLQASGLLGDLSSQYEAGQRANAGSLMSFGNDYYDIMKNQAQAPLYLAQQQAGILGSLPTDAVVSQTQTGKSNPSTLSKIGQGLGIASSIGSLFSDVRLKRDIVKLGEREDGLGVYEFEYVWGGGRQIGILAQEALELRPDVVRLHPSGFLMVDYGAL